MAVAYHVLSQMQKRGFASSDIVHVARGIVDGIEQGWLNKLATHPDGASLLKIIGSILKTDAPGNKNSQRAIKIRIALNSATPKQNNTGQPRKLSSAEIAEYKKKAKKGEVFNEDVVWELPVSSNGYVVYNRNDVGADGLDQIGTKETVEAIINLANAWITHSSNQQRRLLQIGDLSRPGGLDTSQHRGHEDGKIVDIRPLRNDTATGKGANLNFNSPSYDHDLTKAFIRFAKTRHPNIFIRFNDDKIAGKGEFTYVQKDGKGKVHDNHLHLEFR